MGGGHGEVPDSGGSYCSYASSGRGSLEPPPGGRLSLCLSPTLTSSPETVEESQDVREETDLRETDSGKRRKASSVDENYEWDTADEQDLRERAGSPSVSLMKTDPHHLSVPSMHLSSEALKESAYIRGRDLADRYVEPDTVLF